MPDESIILLSGIYLTSSQKGNKMTITSKRKEKFVPRSYKQIILELLRDTKQTTEEISLEIKCDANNTQTIVKQLEQEGLVVRINDNKPYYYTSDYDLLPIKVHQMEYDQFELVIPVSEVVVRRDPLVELFFSEPIVTPYTDDNGMCVLEVSQKQFDKLDSSLNIHPMDSLQSCVFIPDAKFFSSDANQTAYICKICNLKFEDMFGSSDDGFKVVVRA